MTVKPKNSWCLCCKERVAGLIPVLMLHWNLTFRFRVKERHFALKNKSKTNCCSAQSRPTCNCGEGNSGTADQRVVDSRMPARPYGALLMSNSSHDGGAILFSIARKGGGGGRMGAIRIDWYITLKMHQFEFVALCSGIVCSFSFRSTEKLCYD